MYVEKDLVEVGYTLKGNCTSPPSYPYINLTWYLNGRKVGKLLNENSVQILIWVPFVFRINYTGSYFK